MGGGAGERPAPEAAASRLSEGFMEINPGLSSSRSEDGQTPLQRPTVGRAATVARSRPRKPPQGWRMVGRGNRSWVLAPSGRVHGGGQTNALLAISGSTTSSQSVGMAFAESPNICSITVDGNSSRSGCTAEFRFSLTRSSDTIAV